MIMTKTLCNYCACKRIQLKYLDLSVTSLTLLSHVHATDPKSILPHINHNLHKLLHMLFV